MSATRHDHGTSPASRLSPPDSPPSVPAPSGIPAARDRFHARLTSTTAPVHAAQIVGTVALIALGLVAWAEMSNGYETVIHLSVMSGLVVVALCAVWYLAIYSRQDRQHLPGSAVIAHLLREKEAAETANAAKTRYLANVSHEIRSPLNAIYGYAQLVERDNGVGAVEAARVIRRSAEHLTSLVEGLLDISQLESGVLRVKRDVIRIVPFLDQIAWMMRPAATAKGLEFDYILPERVPEFVRVDQSRLRQVLINLLSNAIKFTDAGRVTFRFSWSGQMAVFEVSDTGPGIAAEDRERIFDPYDRGSAEHPQSAPGVGLGLPIAKAIVGILGAKLELDSAPGHGSTFRVTMLLGQVAGMVKEASPSRRVSGYDGDRRSILLVDDDMRQLAFMRSLLESLGFDVAAVPNGETAVSISRARAFDLAILDISMPGISGWETALRLREQPGQDIHIIMLSANTPEFHKPDFPTPVHDMFLIKPVEFGALVDAVGGLLNLAWRTEPARTETGPPMPPPGSSLPPAARVHVDNLRDALRIGHVRGIEAEIALLAAAAPGSAALIAQLHDYLDRFDLAAMARKLEEI